MKESQLVEKIKKHLKKELPGCWINKNFGGRYANAGVPDLQCIYKDHVFFIEVKIKGNYPTEIQKETIKRINKAGDCAVAFVAYSVEEVKDVVTQYYVY